MPEIIVTLIHEAGLHARPAAKFVDAAKKFESEIRVAFEEKDANAKSILSVMGLGAEEGDEITIRAEGEDAEEALERLEELVENKFELEKGEAEEES